MRVEDLKDTGVPWIRELMASGGWFMHGPTRVIDRVTGYCPPGVFISPHLKELQALAPNAVSDAPLKCAVILTEGGHHFTAQHQKDFIPLTEDEAQSLRKVPALIRSPSNNEGACA
jgi:hypothetical protein